MDRACPYCESTKLTLDEAGAVHRCEACQRSSLATDARTTDTTRAVGPSALKQEEETTRTFSLRTRERRGAPGEVASWPAAAIALITTVVFYAVLAGLPMSRFSELFMERGWVPYVITLISIWALLLLAAKLFRLRRERRMLERDLVVTGDSGHLGPQDARAALLALRGESTEVATSFLARRIERALRHFLSRRHSVEVVDFLASETRADEARVDASYGLIRVFVWAVPTLGFIGTVIGIGAAVAGFSETLEAASSLDGMKESIGLVTGGLGVAFDTTLLALVMSILIMFPAAAVQRIEESFLSDVDDYCAEFLVPRLRDEANGRIDQDVVAELARRLAQSMRESES